MGITTFSNFFFFLTLYQTNIDAHHKKSLNNFKCSHTVKYKHTRPSPKSQFHTEIFIPKQTLVKILQGNFKVQFHQLPLGKFGSRVLSLYPCFHGSTCFTSGHSRNRCFWCFHVDFIFSALTCLAGLAVWFARLISLLRLLLAPLSRLSVKAEFN